MLEMRLFFGSFLFFCDLEFTSLLFCGGESVCGGLLPCGCKRRTEYLRTRGVARVAQWLSPYCGVTPPATHMYIR